MTEFPDVVRAPPERVWQALIDPAERARGGNFLIEASLEGGRPGEVDTVALYRTAKAAWRERVLEAEAPERLLVEERDPADDRTRATMAWRVTPIKMGSLLVLEVHGKGLGDSARVRTLDKGRYRRLVEAVKLACEGAPAVRFPAPAKRGFPFFGRPKSATTSAVAAAEPSKLPFLRRKPTAAPVEAAPPRAAEAPPAAPPVETPDRPAPATRPARKAPAKKSQKGGRRRP